MIRLNQEDVLNDKNNWEMEFKSFIDKKNRNNDEIEIYDCSGGERYLN